GDDVVVAWNTGNSTRRNTAFGEQRALVAIGAVHGGRSDHGATVDVHVKIQVRGIDARGALGQQQVGEDNTGALEAIRKIVDLGNGLKTIEDVGGRYDDPRIVAVAGAQHLPEVPLLGLGRNSRRRAGALDVNDDD